MASTRRRLLHAAILLGVATVAVLLWRGRRANHGGGGDTTDRDLGAESSPAGASAARGRPGLPAPAAPEASPPDGERDYMEFADGRYTREELQEMWGVSTAAPELPTPENTAPPREPKKPLTPEERHLRWQRGLQVLDDRIQAIGGQLATAEASGDQGAATRLRVRLERMKQFRERLQGDDPLHEEPGAADRK
jgi:hypothetical protein